MEHQKAKQKIGVVSHGKVLEVQRVGGAASGRRSVGHKVEGWER